ncbi:MAG: ergothioneine biosynthesis protein EgtC [Acidimicrobiales bacterium]|nr:ergothioneine biosynthesis protein EgtC [Acidimicrobiales bacterium]
MCRHLAYLGPPRSLSSLLYEPPHSLERQSWRPQHQREGAMNADGWGVGWWDPARRAEPARYRTAAPMWTDRSFRSVAELVHAGAIVAATRSATPPSPVVSTGNAPFVSGPWLFSLNGFVTGFRGPIGEHLRRAVSEERSVGIEGSADTEVLFALVLDQLDAGVPPPTALTKVTTDVLDATRGRLNFLLCDGHTLTATASGNSLFTLRGAGLADGGVVVASEPLDDHPAWEPVADGSVVVATSDRLDVVAVPSIGDPL